MRFFSKSPNAVTRLELEHQKENRQTASPWTKNRRPGFSQLPATFFLVALFLAVSLNGCGGSTPDNKKTESLKLGKAHPYPGVHLKKLIKKKPDSNDPTRKKNPDDKSPSGSKKKKNEKPQYEDDRDNFLVKSKHWTIIQAQGDSKKTDFNGRLTARFFSSDASELIGDDYEMRIDRPASLTKNQPKNFAIPVYPTAEAAATLDAYLTNLSGFRQAGSATTFRMLLPNQYNFVVLSKSSSSYSFLKFLPTVRNMKFNQRILEENPTGNLQLGDSFDENPSEGEEEEVELFEKSMYYRIVFSDWKDRAEVPANVAQWTSTAYLIWGDYDPELLTTDQQNALVDWLNFGGQLIVSGEAIDSLRGSFLEPYLPLTIKTVENRPLSRLRSLMQNWNELKEARTVSGLSDKEQLGIWVGELKPQSRFLPGSDELVADRSVGKGRVTLVRFPLNSKVLRSWDGLDNWFNHALLGRPGRSFDYNDEPGPGGYSSVPIQSKQPYKWRWDHSKDERKSTDPFLSTTLRFASHDWKSADPAWLFRDFLTTADLKKTSDEESGDSPHNRGGVNTKSKLSTDFHRPVTRFYEGAGLTPGQWNDESALGLAGKKIIADYSGIAPPNRQWVLTSLLLYIAILVPLNYIIFRLAGKIEWAWAAVPLIAIGSGFVVVKAASLDIGFSNKMVQVNVLEIPANYHRAQLTGYGSIYTSLSQFFRFQSENPTTIVLPMEVRKKNRKESQKTVFQYDFSQEPEFGPLQVDSNATDHFHLQQMVDVGGGFSLSVSELGEMRVNNGSQLSLRDCLVMWDDSENGNTIKYAFIKSLAEGGNERLEFQEPKSFFEMTKVWDGTPMKDFSEVMRNLIGTLEGKGEKPLRLLEPTTVIEILRESFPKVATEVENQVARNADGDDSDQVSHLLLEKAIRRAYFSNDIRLGELAYQAARNPLGKGEIRMIAWTDQDFSQLKITPPPTQINQRTFVVSQLRATEIPTFEKDENLALSSKKKTAGIVDESNLEQKE